MILAIVAGVGGFWLLLITLVRYEKGWVGVSDLRRAQLRLTGAFFYLNRAVGAALIPTIQKTTRAFKRLAADLSESKVS